MRMMNRYKLTSAIILAFPIIIAGIVVNIQNQNFLAECHFVFRAVGSGSGSSSTTAPRLDIVSSDTTDDWLTFADAILDVALEDYTIGFGESECFILRL